MLRKLVGRRTDGEGGAKDVGQEEEVLRIVEKRSDRCPTTKEERTYVVISSTLRPLSLLSFSVYASPRIRPLSLSLLQPRQQQIQIRVSTKLFLETLRNRAELGQLRLSRRRWTARKRGAEVDDGSVRCGVGGRGRRGRGRSRGESACRL